MEFGLSLKQKEGLISIFDKHLKQGKVIVYGSRAKGNFTPRSDLDLAIQSANADRHLLAAIVADIMESDFPYLCDIQYLEEIKSPRLLDHIKRMGKTFYQKESGKMAGWEQATLGIVCEVIAGQSPKGSNYNNSGDGLPFYQGKKEFGDRYLGAPTKWTTQITREATAGDVLMSVRAPVGPINFSTERICIGRGLASIRAKEQIHRDFLFYLLLSMQEQITGSEGAVFASINKKQIESIRFRKPTIPEQERIVAILDEAFAAIATATANTKKNLANTRELFASQLEQAFTGDVVNARWAHKPIAEACLFRPPKLEAKMKLNIDDEVSFVSMKSLGIRQKIFDSTQAKPLGNVYGAYTYFADRDVLLAKITPCFQNGKLGIASGLKNGIGFGSSEFFVFRCPHQISPEFLFYFLS
ncbi:restriction endonuclease subunit S [Candidatus Spongiihabitans sp.]|uniref:restriction endonuclease subunit S n=1 Tax=Candidatus Spongiihabitans sp. TaxID=3101308 RepID=UPI003C702AFE